MYNYAYVRARLADTAECCAGIDDVPISPSTLNSRSLVLRRSIVDTCCKRNV